MRASRCSIGFLGCFLVTTTLLQWWQQSSYGELILCLSFIGAITALLALDVTIRPIAGYITAGLLGGIAALFVVANTTHLPHLNSIDAYATNQAAIIYGTIAAEPDRRPMQTKYTIAVQAIENPATGMMQHGIGGRVLITDHAFWPQFEFGDSVTVRGRLQRPGQIEDFHYDQYLSRFGIYSVMYRGSIRKHVSDFNRDVPLGRLTDKTFKHMFSLKHSFEAQINRLLPEPHASFMAGLLTGSRRGIPKHLMEDFNTTGLTHIIAISGYNITIVIAVIMGLLCWLPKKWRLLPAAAAIIGFTLFVGASAAVVRAAIMGILGLLALQLERQSHVRLGILWTAFFMTAYNPKYLWYDAGFQLSFLAVLGLVELAPYLDRFFKRVPATLGLREALQMTIAAQLAAVPLIVFLFGRLSLIAPVANVLIAPFVPLAMLFGFVGTVLSMIFYPLGLLIMYIGWGCLEWISQVAKQLAQLPYATVDIEMSAVGMLMYYSALILCLVLLYKQNDGFIQK